MFPEHWWFEGEISFWNWSDVDFRGVWGGVLHIFLLQKTGRTPHTSTGPLFTSPGDFSDLTWCQTTRRKPSDPRVLTASSCWAPCQNIKSASNLVIWALLSDQQMRGLDDHFPQWRAKGCNKVALAVVFFDWTNIQQTFCWTLVDVGNAGFEHLRLICQLINSVIRGEFHSD